MTDNTKSLKFRKGKEAVAVNLQEAFKPYGIDFTPGENGGMEM